MKKILGKLFVILLFFVLSRAASAQANGLTISNITDNRANYTGGQVPKYEKFETTFIISGTVASNLNLPYDANPPAGLTPRIGITVNAEFSADNWISTIVQPAFVYQPYDYQVKGGRDWVYPVGNLIWKARFAPDRTGQWKYRIRATDSNGTVVTPDQMAFNVIASGDKGFVRISQSDKRYFEFDDGSLFTGLGYNMNYSQVDWKNPVLYNLPNFQKMKENGIEFIRIWLSQWSIFGSSWNPWKSIKAQNSDPPLELLAANTGDMINSQNTFSLKIGTAHPCIFHDPNNSARIAVKRSTTYRIRVRLFPENLVGEGGFVVKKSNGFDCSGATAITQYIRTGASRAWQWLEGDFTTGVSEDFIIGFFLNLENMTGGSVRISDVEVRELVSGLPSGPNIIDKPKMDHNLYFEQRNSYAFDKVLDLAHEYDIYLKPVTLDHREWIFNHTNHAGNPTGDFGCSDPNIPSTCPSPGYLYGDTGRADTKNRWLQKAWWRYLHARWGYSTNIHSWEYVNEGTTGTEHAVAADIFGRYFDSYNSNKHLTSTSSWNQNRSTASWWGGFTDYPGIDFADIHKYVSNEDPSGHYYDLAEMAIAGSNTHGAKNPSVNSRFPVIRGETGLHKPPGSMTTELQNTNSSHNGLWLHNYIWASLNSGALYEASWWWPTQQIYPGSFDLRPLFKPLHDFLSDIPLNKGGYAEVAPIGYDVNTIRVVGQKNISTNKAHLWIQNKHHIWCAVAGNISGCPQVWNNSRLDGTVSFSGFPPGLNLPVEYWMFDNSSTLTKQVGTISTNQGTINIALNALPATVVDVGIKIGDYRPNSTTPTPTGSITPLYGDIVVNNRVDINDFSAFLNYFRTGNTAGDINNDNRVNIFDFSILLANYGHSR